MPVGDEEPVRVLIVDDDRAFRRTLAMGLELRGFEVHEAGDGTAAVQEARECQPDVVVLDCVMPDLGGPRALPGIRQAAPEAVIVFYTADYQRFAEYAPHPSGPEEVWEKGMSPRELSRALRDVVARRRSGLV